MTNFPRQKDKEGNALTFEQLIADFIAQGLRPDQAVRAATTQRPDLQREYYARLLHATKEHCK
jgi:hypothetical protein